MHTQAPVALEQRLLQKQMDMLAGNMTRIAAGTTVLASGTSLMLVITGGTAGRVMAWLIGMVGFQALRLGAFRRFRRHGITGSNASRWAVAAATASALAGGGWGMLALLFFDPNAPLTLAILTVVLSAILASSTNSIGAYWPATLAFALPCALPMAVLYLVEPAPELRILGLLTLAYLAFTVTYAHGIARMIRDSLLLRFENQTLLDSLQQAKERAEAASQSKSRFLATASHDLRQPIHAINLCLPMLRQMAPAAPGLSTAMNDATHRIQQALDNMGKLLHLLLDVSRLDAGGLMPKLEPCSVGKLLQGIADQFQSQANAKGLVIRVADRGDWVLCDAVMLHSMVSNLVHNAVRYTDRGGLLLGTRLRDNRVQIEVWDTGRGVPPDDMPKLCEEFFQASNAHRQNSPTRGFGLGLAIVQRMAHLAGGELKIRSKLGRGSCFSIALPASTSAPDVAEEPAIAVAPSRSRKLLVIDSDVHILAAIRDLLQSWGHEVIAAESLDDALPKAAEHAHQIDLALVDFPFVNQTTGAEAVLTLRQALNRDLPLVVLTGDTASEVSQWVQQANVRVVYKPVKPATLQGIIEGCD